MIGICTSMQITSGCRADAAATASCAVRGLADHDDVAGRLEDRAEAGAHHRVVIDQQHADHRRPATATARSSGTATRTRNPPRSRGPISIDAARGGRALAHAQLAQSGPRLAHRPAGVDDLELDEPVVGVAQPNLGGGARSAVASRVGERLLGDAVQVHLGDLRHGHRVADDRERGGQARRLRCRGQRRQCVEADGRRRRVVGRAGRAQGVEQPVQLVDRLAGRGLDAGEQAPALIDVASRASRARGSGLHAHHRHVVRHDVVQLAGDAARGPARPPAPR